MFVNLDDISSQISRISLSPAVSGHRACLRLMIRHHLHLHLLGHILQLIFIFRTLLTQNNTIILTLHRGGKEAGVRVSR